MDSDPFLQNDGVTMKNRLGIKTPEVLRFAERELSNDRSATVGMIEGNFDEQHLRDIHHHLFERVYEWAGTMRHDTIELEGEKIRVSEVAGVLSKGSTSFLPAMNRPLFAGDPEVRILGYGKEQMWKQIFT